MTKFSDILSSIEKTDNIFQTIQNAVLCGQPKIQRKGCYALRKFLQGLKNNDKQFYEFYVERFEIAKTISSAKLLRKKKFPNNNQAA